MPTRPADPARDLDALIALYCHLMRNEPTPEYVQGVINEGTVRVLTDEHDAVIGFWALSRRGTMPPDQFFLWMAVDAPHRRNGMGHQLMRDALAVANERDMASLISQLNDDNAAGFAFCHAHDFQPTRHMINLTLDLKTITARPQPSHTSPPDVRFMTFDALGNTPENRQRLYQLNKALSATIPVDHHEPFAPYERWAERRLDRDVMRHDGIVVALLGDAWIGMTQVSIHAGFGFVEMTGVLPDYRGRGIAQALKAQSIAYARRQGVPELRTFNDMGNAPMIAVNQKAGFHKQDGFYYVRKDLTQL